VDRRDLELAERTRATIETAAHDPSTFRAALLAVPPASRDAWLDLVLGLDDVPADGPALPRHCVPYLPCPVDALLRLIDQAPVRSSDVFVDIGSGPGRAAILVHLLTGATAIGIEIQPMLVAFARELASRFKLPRVTSIEGDAAALGSSHTAGTVFFLYCPFSGERLNRVLDELEPIAKARPITIGTVDLPLPARPWLALDPGADSLAIYRSG
jgi:SAM-dependent methyltransferase